MHANLTVHIAGEAFDVEDAGYQKLRAYLAVAKQRFAQSTGAERMLRELEEGIAEKCRECLAAGKQTLTEEDIDHILAEFGPLPAARAETPRAAEKRLFRTRRGALIAGVCSGLADYFNLDASFVRAIFIILAIFTGGGWILVYCLMMLTIPYAKTQVELSKARGETPPTHKEPEEDAQVHASTRAWGFEIRDRLRMETQLRAPIGALLRLFMTLAWFFVLVSLLATGTLFGWPAPADLPLWISVIFLFILYIALLSPWRIFKKEAPVHAGKDILWLIGIVLAGWLAYTYLPPVHQLFDAVEELSRPVLSLFGIDSN